MCMYVCVYFLFLTTCLHTHPANLTLLRPSNAFLSSLGDGGFDPGPVVFTPFSPEKSGVASHFSGSQQDISECECYFLAENEENVSWEVWE